MAEEADGIRLEQRHGKARVRVARVWRNDHNGSHHFVEWNVSISLLSHCLSSYHRDDNSDIVATDTMKNTVYVKAKECGDRLSVEEFAILIGKHFCSFYPQVYTAIVNIIEKPWERVSIDGKPHLHGFKLGTEKHTVEATVQKSGALNFTSGIVGLALLKTTQSGFEKFVRDKYTILPDTQERMLATEVNASWRYSYESVMSIPTKELCLDLQSPNHNFSSTSKLMSSTSSNQMGELVADKHVRYILMAEKKKESFESVVMDHLRMNGAYWGLTTLDLLDKLGTVSEDEVVSWIMTCQHESGGFAGNVGHDPHILYTLSAVQILALFDKINILDVGKVSSYVTGLQNEDGSFSGDMWGEIDTRFSYIAICCLSILKTLENINVEKAVDYIVSCKNLDGGFGCTPGAESHAGQIFCCVGALALTGSLHRVDKDLLGWWLCERQGKSGGLNGRPEKQPDVCYSWWVLSSLIMIDRVHWIDKEKLVKFILDCQDLDNGGISDRPDDAVDIFHTYFGVAGLSLLEYPGVKAIDPAYALPVDVVNRIIFTK